MADPTDDPPPEFGLDYAKAALIGLNLLGGTLQSPDHGNFCLGNEETEFFGERNGASAVRHECRPVPGIREIACNRRSHPSSRCGDQRDASVCHGPSPLMCVDTLLQRPPGGVEAA